MIRREPPRVLFTYDQPQLKVEKYPPRVLPASPANAANSGGKRQLAGPAALTTESLGEEGASRRRQRRRRPADIYPPSRLTDGWRTTESLGWSKGSGFPPYPPCVTQCASGRRISNFAVAPQFMHQNLHFDLQIEDMEIKKNVSIPFCCDQKNILFSKTCIRGTKFWPHFG